MVCWLVVFEWVGAVYASGILASLGCIACLTFSGLGCGVCTWVLLVWLTCGCVVFGF